MKRFCPDCGCEFERNFCPKCGLMGLTEEEYKAYKKAMEYTSENVIEESMKSGEQEKVSQPEPPVEVKITDITGIKTDVADETTEFETSDDADIQEPYDADKEEIKDTNCSCSEPCSGTCHSCCDDDCSFDKDDDAVDLEASTFDGKKTAKLAIGAACFIGAVMVAIKVIKRKK